MIRIALAIGAAVAAFVPATFGLLGNNTFAQSVPVRVPASAQVLPSEDQTPTPSATAGHDVGDDHGGDRPRDGRVEPGDDRDPSPSASSSAKDDRRGRGSDDSGSDDSRHRSGSDDSGRDDRGGHGSDDSGDDHGGHGSDD